MRRGGKRPIGLLDDPAGGLLFIGRFLQILHVLPYLMTKQILEIYGTLESDMGTFLGQFVEKLSNYEVVTSKDNSYR